MRSLERWRTVIVGLFLVLVGQIAAVYFGWYEVDYVWFDLLLHLISGAILAIIWLNIARADLFGSNLWFFVLTTATFALLGSFAWELFEFFLELSAPNLAQQYSLNSPRISDALTDMLAGMFGGFIWAYFIYKNRDKSEPRE